MCSPPVEPRPLGDNQTPELPNGISNSWPPGASVVAVLSLLVALASLQVTYTSFLSTTAVSAWQIITAQSCGNSGKVSALKVLGRRGETIKKIDFVWASRCPTERYVYLAEVGLRGHDLRELRMTHVDLSDADFRRTDLRFAVMPNVRLIRARLNRAKMDDATLNATILQSAVLVQASLKNADLRGVDMRQTDVRDGVLDGANLRNADLRNADFTDASFEATDLRGAKMNGANLSGASLKSAAVTSAELKGAWRWEGNPPTGVDDRAVNILVCDRVFRGNYLRSGAIGTPDPCRFS